MLQRKTLNDFGADIHEMDLTGYRNGMPTILSRRVDKRVEVWFLVDAATNTFELKLSYPEGMDCNEQEAQCKDCDCRLN